MRTEPPARPHSVLSPQSSTLRQVASLVSVVLHPFVVIPSTILLLTGRTSSLGFALATVVPIFALIAIQVRRGQWSNFDVSVRSDRPHLYLAAIVVTALMGAVMYASEGSTDLVRGFAAVAIMLAVAMLVNRFIKVSMHLMFAAFCAVAVGWRLPQTIPLLAIALVLLIWSRLILRRHTALEVAIGTLLGAATAFVLVLT